MLYSFAIGAGALSLLVAQLEVTQSLALISVFSIVLVIIGVYLSKVKVYESEQEALAGGNNAAFAFLVNFSYKRRIFEVFLDAFLITLAYYTAFVIVFGPFEETANWDLFLKSLPILVLLKLSAFLIVGVYRGLWRYTSIGDMITFAKGSALGSVLSVLALLLLYRFEYFSRTVLVIDGMLVLGALVGSRMMFRLIRQAIPLPVGAEGRRALIYGAGDGGEMVLRELRNNPELNYVPVGFIDDDPRKSDKLIHGLKVFSADHIVETFEETKSSEMLISTGKLEPAKLRELRELCRENNISLKRVRMSIEPVDFE